MRKTKKFRKTILFVLLIALTFSCKNEKQDEKTIAIKYMETIARETNEKGKLPAQVDEYTIAEKVTFDSKTNVLTYNYKLYTDTYSRYDWQRMLREIEVEQIQNAKNLHSDNKYYRFLKVTINSVYKDFDGKEIYSFKIKPEQYL